MGIIQGHPLASRCQAAQNTPNPALESPRIKEALPVYRDLFQISIAGFGRLVVVDKSVQGVYTWQSVPIFVPMRALFIDVSLEIMP